MSTPVSCLSCFVPADSSCAVRPNPSSPAASACWDRSIRTASTTSSSWVPGPPVSLLPSMQVRKDSRCSYSTAVHSAVRPEHPLASRTRRVDLDARRSVIWLTKPLGEFCSYREIPCKRLPGPALSSCRTGGPTADCHFCTDAVTTLQTRQLVLAQHFDTTGRANRAVFNWI
jgi:hypothetical protein